MNHTKECMNFLMKWQRLVPPERRSEFVEDARAFNLHATASYEAGRANGTLGPNYLQGCLDTLHPIIYTKEV